MCMLCMVTKLYYTQLYVAIMYTQVISTCLINVHIYALTNDHYLQVVDASVQFDMPHHIYPLQVL